MAGTTKLPHPEEPPQAASRRTHQCRSNSFTRSQHEASYSMALRKIPYPEAPRAKRGLEGRTTFFQPYGIFAEPLLFRPTLLRPRPCNLRLGATQGYRGVRQPALRSQQ